MFNKTRENIKWFLLILLSRLDSIFKNWSSTRIMSVSLVIVPLVVWSIICLTTWVIVPIPDSIVTLMIAGLSGKVISQFVDIKKEKNNA
jgi:hypothetical protein